MANHHREQCGSRNRPHPYRGPAACHCDHGRSARHPDTAADQDLGKVMDAEGQAAYAECCADQQWEAYSKQRLQSPPEQEEQGAPIYRGRSCGMPAWTTNPGFFQNSRAGKTGELQYGHGAKNRNDREKPRHKAAPPSGQR